MTAADHDEIGALLVFLANGTLAGEEKARVEKFQRMTPEKIAPLVVYLASDQAKGVSGQIFSVRNNEIYLFSQPRPVETLHEPKGWTPSGIAGALKDKFGAKLTPLERTTDVINWDPR